MAVQMWQRRSAAFRPCQSPAVLKASPCCSVLLACCLAAVATGTLPTAHASPASAPGRQDPLTKVDVSTITSRYTQKLVQWEDEGKDYELNNDVRKTSVAGENDVFSGDVSDDEDLTPVGSGSGTLYLHDVMLKKRRRQSKILHTVEENKRSHNEFSCCMVGKVAASRHIHCHAQYHVDRVGMRQSTEITSPSRQDMRASQYRQLEPTWFRDFDWCVTKKPLLFQKCCYGYVTSRSDKLRWYNYRKTGTGSLQSHHMSWRYPYS